MEAYVIKLDQDDYYQARGGYDWGRSDKSSATTFDTVERAKEEIKSRGLKSFGARIVRAY
jgi:hypothetical protein